MGTSPWRGQIDRAVMSALNSVISSVHHRGGAQILRRIGCAPPQFFVDCPIIQAKYVI